MLSPHDLAALIAVADEGSIHGAASILGRTQPAVTQAIQRLEEAVGFPLLDRSGYRVKLTERGELFVKRARVTVKQARNLQAFATVLSREVEAHLRIAVHGAVPVMAWMPLIEDLPQRFPDTVLEIQVGEGDTPMRRLMNDESDLAIALHSVANHHVAGVERRYLGEMEFVNVVQAAHLTSNEEEILAALPQIIVADFDDPNSSYGVVEGHRHWRVSNHRLKVAAIIAGAGWGSVPAAMVETELRDGTLRSITYRGLGPGSPHPFFLCQKRDRPLGPVATYIWEKLSDTE